MGFSSGSVITKVYCWSQSHIKSTPFLSTADFAFCSYVKRNTNKPTVFILKPSLGMGIKLSFSTWTSRELQREREGGVKMTALSWDEFPGLWGSHCVPAVGSFGVWLSSLYALKGCRLFLWNLNCSVKSHFVNSLIYFCCSETVLQKSLLWRKISTYPSTHRVRCAEMSSLFYFLL